MRSSWWLLWHCSSGFGTIEISSDVFVLSYWMFLLVKVFLSLLFLSVLTFRTPLWEQFWLVKFWVRYNITAPCIIRPPPSCSWHCHKLLKGERYRWLLFALIIPIVVSLWLSLLSVAPLGKKCHQSWHDFDECKCSPVCQVDWPEIFRQLLADMVMARCQFVIDIRWLSWRGEIYGDKAKLPRIVASQMSEIVRESMCKRAKRTHSGLSWKKASHCAT